MLELKKIIYVPALRMKKGELEGLRALRPDVAACVLPRLIIPPAGERESSSQEDLFGLGDDAPDIGGILSKYWRRRDVLIDITYLIDEYQAAELSSWLPALFSRAKSLDIDAVLCINLTDLEKVDTLVLKQVIERRAGLKLGLVVSSTDMTDFQLQSRIQHALSALSLAISECAVLADFSEADLTDPELVFPIIQATLEQLQEIGQWRHIIFQGTHYPEKNPASPNETKLWPRNEWQAWHKAVRFDPSTAENFIFGDYAADCSKIRFGAKGGRPIVHLRYTTDSHWIIARAAETGTQAALMKNVCERVEANAQFSNASFSEADRHIYDIAHGNVDNTGNASTWRQINTTHHITRVVTDVAKVRGISIKEIPASPLGVQFALLA